MGLYFSVLNTIVHRVKGFRILRWKVLKRKSKRELANSVLTGLDWKINWVGFPPLTYNNWLFNNFSLTPCTGDNFSLTPCTGGIYMVHRIHMHAFIYTDIHTGILSFMYACTHAILAPTCIHIFDFLFFFQMIEQLTEKAVIGSRAVVLFLTIDDMEVMLTAVQKAVRLNRLLKHQIVFISTTTLGDHQDRVSFFFFFIIIVLSYVCSYHTQSHLINKQYPQYLVQTLYSCYRFPSSSK